jgi:hypothetical protein
VIRTAARFRSGRSGAEKTGIGVTSITSGTHPVGCAY